MSKSELQTTKYGGKQFRPQSSFTRTASRQSKGNSKILSEWRYIEAKNEIPRFNEEIDMQSTTKSKITYSKAKNKKSKQNSNVMTQQETGNIESDRDYLSNTMDQTSTTPSNIKNSRQGSILGTGRLHKLDLSATKSVVSRVSSKADGSMKSRLT